MIFALDTLIRAVLLTISWMGTSPLALVVGLGVAFLFFFGPFLLHFFRAGFPSAWRDHKWAGIGKKTLVVAGIWAALIAWACFYTIPHQIRSQAQAVVAPHLKPIPTPWSEIFKNSPRTVSPNPARREPDPYAITVDFLIGGDNIAETSFLWMRQNGVANSGDVLFPANLTAHVTIVSHRGTPVLVSGYSIEAKSKDGSFVRLNELPILPAGRELYMGNAPQQLGRVGNEFNLLSRVIDGHTIESFGSVRGWILFQFPVGECRNFVRGFRMTIKDYGGHSYTSRFLTPTDLGKAQTFGLLTNGETEDLSRLPLEFVDEASAIVPFKPCGQQP